MILKKQIAGYASDKETSHCFALLRSEIWIAPSALGFLAIAVEPPQNL
jgi:hypothetical protein